MKTDWALLLRGCFTGLLTNYSESLHTVRQVLQAAKSQLKWSKTLTLKLSMNTLVEVLFPL